MSLLEIYHSAATGSRRKRELLTPLGLLILGLTLAAVIILGLALSPDGTELAFVRENQLMRLEIGGAAPFASAVTASLSQFGYRSGVRHVGEVNTIRVTESLRGPRPS